MSANVKLPGIVVILTSLTQIVLASRINIAGPCKIIKDQVVKLGSTREKTVGEKTRTIF